MRKWLAQRLYNFIYRREEKKGYIQKYSYETAPYCGHHYSGHTGKYCYGHFHEGDGSETAHLRFGKLWITAYHHTDEGWSLCFQWLSKLYYKSGEFDGHMGWYATDEPQQIGWYMCKGFRFRRMHRDHTDWMPDWYREGKEFRTNNGMEADEYHIDEARQYNGGQETGQ